MNVEEKTRTSPAAQGELTQRLASRDPDSFLTRTDLLTLGLPRRAVDVIFRGVAQSGGTVHLPGYRRPLIRVRDFLAFMEEHTYRDDRVRHAA